MLNEWIEKSSSGLDLTPTEAETALADLLSETSNDDEREKFLRALGEKGESVGEICGFVSGMMARCARVELPKGGVDLCGTGGSGLERFNVSTTAAFVLASMGVGVVKHGNRGSKSANGSFDLLEKLGIDLTLDIAQQVESYKRNGLCFLFARMHHPAVKAVGPARAKILRRTIFNLVGPLCNPASVEQQVIGVSDLALGPKMAEAMCRLGRKKAAVVWGEPGIDEFSVSGISRVWWVENGKVREDHVHPDQLGIEVVSWSDLPKGDCDLNLRIFHQLLAGKSMGGLSNMVALNAAAGLIVAGRFSELNVAFYEAQRQLASGRVSEFFRSLKYN